MIGIYIFANIQLNVSWICWLLAVMGGLVCVWYNSTRIWYTYRSDTHWLVSVFYSDWLLCFIRNIYAILSFFLFDWTFRLFFPFFYCSKMYDDNWMPFFFWWYSANINFVKSNFQKKIPSFIFVHLRAP